MDGRAIHRCLHVLDLERSLRFYKEALGMDVVSQMGPDDGSWSNTFIANDACGFQLELTWNQGRAEPYDNGGRDSHIAFIVPSFDEVHALHEKMGCICHENAAMGLYFIEDPDGCWIEILPESPRFNAQAGVDVLAAMRRRRSVRKYADEPIPDGLLDRILEAGLLSASGRGERPWELYVVRERGVLEQLSACRDHGSAMLKDAGAAIVVAADPNASDTWIEDCSIVMANMHLEASASGVASCWIQVRGRVTANGASTSDFIVRALGVPEALSIEAVLSLGMPLDSEQAARSFDEGLWSKVHR